MLLHKVGPVVTPDSALPLSSDEEEREALGLPDRREERAEAALNQPEGLAHRCDERGRSDP